MRKLMVLLGLAVVVLANTFGFSEKKYKDMYTTYQNNKAQYEKLAKSYLKHPIYLQSRASASADYIRSMVGAINLYNQNLNIYGKKFENTISWETIYLFLVYELGKKSNYKDLFLEVYRIYSCRFDPDFEEDYNTFIITSFLLEKSKSKCEVVSNILSLFLIGKKGATGIRNLSMY